MSGPNWATSYELARDILERRLELQDSVDQKVASRIVKAALEFYLTQGLEQGLGRDTLHRRMRSKVNSWVLRIPRLLENWNSVRSRLPGVDNQFSLPSLRRKSSQYHEDFSPVYQSLMGTREST